jgi:hypothetical protein
MSGNSSKKDSAGTAEFYKLDYANLPDALFRSDVPVEKWLATCETTKDKKGFPPNSLNKIHPIPWDVEYERLVGIALYMIMNVFPFMIVPLLLLYFVVATYWAKLLVWVLFGYVGILGLVEHLYFQPRFLHKYQQGDYFQSHDMDFKNNQYVFTERNTNKYLSTSFVWPKSIHPPALKDTPVLFCIVPHGVAPFGITAYPMWSKVWNARLCRWTSAPVVLKIPIVGYLIRKIGYIPAKAPNIMEALTKREENVGIILDGIAGMFHQSTEEETAFLKQRKGIVKIALKAGVPIVPVYGFGHTACYKVIVDPFGIMEKLSNALQASLTPFFGRYGWLLGAPSRIAVTVCLGNPVMCPKTDDPTKEQINDYHARLLQSYQEVFDQHKEAYGWKEKRLHFV